MRIHYWIVKLTIKLFPELFKRYFREYKQVDREYQWQKEKKEMEYGRTN